MERLLFTILLVADLFIRTSASAQDTAVYTSLHGLAEKIHLKRPNPRRNEYEVRIWQKKQLLFGPAHVVYVLKRKAKRVQLAKYQLYSDNQGFRRFKKSQPVHSIDSSLWNRLVQLDILTLPTWSTVKAQFYSRRKKDSTQVSIESDGSITVKANRTEPSFIVGDGETYYFEVFRREDHRAYSYDNPVSYVRVKPLPELQKVVAILDELSAAFEYRQHP